MLVFFVVLSTALVTLSLWAATTRRIRKFIGNFQWGGQDGCPSYAVGPAQATAAVAMSRRGCGFTAAHEELFQILAG